MRKKLGTIGLSILGVLLSSVLSSGEAAAQPTSAPANMGLYAVTSQFNKYLQAHKDNGELHASNDSRSTEETWYLFSVDKDKHYYALQNFSNRFFLTKVATQNCAQATAPVLGPNETFELVYFNDIPIPSVAGIRFLNDGKYLTGNDPDHNNPDPGCGGEVGAQGTRPNSQNYGQSRVFWHFFTVPAP